MSSAKERTLHLRKELNDDILIETTQREREREREDKDKRRSRDGCGKESHPQNNYSDDGLSYIAN